MKTEKLSESLNDIFDEMVDEAIKYGERTPKKRKNPWIGWVAACAVIACAILVFKPFAHEAPPVTTDGDGQADAAEDSGDADIPEEYAGSAVYVPKIQLPENTDGVTVDMIGLVVYKGAIYTQARYYTGADAERVLPLVGEKLGYAIGNINEWSSQDEYAAEFASNIAGDVYSVVGSDDSFRLCMTGEYEDEDGVGEPYVWFFENLNGIGLDTGKDLFGDRLGLRDKWSGVLYQEHDSWNNGWPDYVFKELPGVTEEDINAFLDELNASPFVDLTGTDIYATPEELDPTAQAEVGGGAQGHLFFTLSDGTNIGLRLIEGGYVEYQNLGWYFVKMPGAVFDKIFDSIT